MKTKTGKQYRVKMLNIDVKLNDDRTDIRAGGSPVLGFDLMVDADRTDAELKRWAQAMMARNGLPFMRAMVGDPYWSVDKPSIKNSEKLVARDAPGMR